MLPQLSGEGKTLAAESARPDTDWFAWAAETLAEIQDVLRNSDHPRARLAAAYLDAPWGEIEEIRIEAA